MSYPTAPSNAPRKRRLLFAALAGALVVVVALIVGISIAKSSARPDPGPSEDAPVAEGRGTASDPVRIGVVGADDPHWTIYKQAAADAGIAIELVDFTDYTQPNPALSAGDLDLNQFQHVIYLAEYNETAGANLVPIGATAIFPLSLYSTKYTSIDDIQKGETIAVPADASNLARALLLLQSAGLVELRDGGSPFSTIDEVLESSTVTVTPLEAALTPGALPTAAGAVINNDFVEGAGLSFDDAIAMDDPSDPSAQPYINVFAARADDRADGTLNELVRIFQSTTPVTDSLVRTSGGVAVLLRTPVTALEETLRRVQIDYRARAELR